MKTSPPVAPYSSVLPTMMFSVGSKGEPGGRLDDDPPAGQPLAQVVVGVADQPQGHARGQERAEALAGRAAEGDLDRAVGQARGAVALDDAVAEDRAHRAVDVADGQLQPRPAPAARSAALDLRQDLPVEVVLVRVGLRPHAPQRAAVGGDSGAAKTAEKSSPLAFQWSIALRQPSRSTRPIISSNVRKPSWAMICRTSSATNVRNRTTYSGLAGEPLAELRVLRGDADRAGARGGTCASGCSPATPGPRCRSRTARPRAGPRSPRRGRSSSGRRPARGCGRAGR